MGSAQQRPGQRVGCERLQFVSASTVTAKFEKDFMGIHSKKPRGMRKFFSTIQVVMRQNVIQNHNMNAVTVSSLGNFVIAPDVTSLTFRSSPAPTKWL
jgi:hypothetical protein